ncbi:MAG: WecB/TagA/CpsF family glycosyltransferase [Fimbriimonadaceae bacterium]|nr:WecB/TagA/CpsF family glycosyltransferase [Fimbriimonadaceae bacterium]
MVETSSVARDLAPILGTPVDLVDMDRAIAAIESLIRVGEPSLVVTVDTSAIVLAQTDAELREVQAGASLATPDSIGVLWALRRRGIALPERVSGVDLVARICGLSADHGYRIFLLGAAPGVAEMAAERLRLLYPGCNIVGTRHGYFPPESDETVAAEVAAYHPDVLIVAMGIPRQEKFLWRTRHLHRAKVGIGVGGSLDVFGGKAKRAPRIVQRLNLEWLWRLILNPRKLPKALTLPKFVWMVLTRR